MKKWNIIFFIFFFQASFASDSSLMIPFHFEQTMPPLNKITRIEINKANAGKLAISYSVTQNGSIKKVRKEFSKEIVDQLFLKLNTKAYPAISSWPSDPDCMLSERFRLQFGSSKKEICTNTNLLHSIKDFQSSIELIMR